MKLFVNGFMIFVGRISFSLYIVHFLVLELIAKRYLWKPDWENPSDESYLLAYPVLLLTSVALSSITYFAVERNGIKMGNRLIQWLETRHEMSESEKPKDQPRAMCA
jgi:peptidoglycan/LPS O-acetylase OafA/YrhL